MIKRALAKSEADMQVEMKPSADDGTVSAGVKLGLSRKNKAAEPVDEKHPDDNKTKDGFYLKDSDDESDQDSYSESSGDYDDEEDDGERENNSKH